MDFPSLKKDRNPEQTRIEAECRPFELAYNTCGRGGCHLFIPSNGYFGTTQQAFPGDQICFLYDSFVPFILRSGEGAEVCELVSECYLHNFMHGEVLGEPWNLGDLIVPVIIE